MSDQTMLNCVDDPDCLCLDCRQRNWIAEQITPAPVIRTAHGNCAACSKPFDPSDTRWNGQGRYENTDFCASCVDRCHDNETADHRCPVCAAKPFSGRNGASSR